MTKEHPYNRDHKSALGAAAFLLAYALKKKLTYDPEFSTKISQPLLDALNHSFIGKAMNQASKKFTDTVSRNPYKATMLAIPLITGMWSALKEAEKESSTAKSIGGAFLKGAFTVPKTIFSEVTGIGL